MKPHREPSSTEGTTPAPLFCPGACESSDRPVRARTVPSEPTKVPWPIADLWVGRPASEAAEGGGSDPFRILLPYNGTAVARKALDVATNLGRGRSAVVWVLYIRPWDIGRGRTRFCLETPDEARQCAQTAVTELRRRGVAASAVVRDARREKVPHAIAAEAQRLDVSCIVLGTHARRALVSALLGSTCLTVARRATHPIILVKAPNDTQGRLLPWRSTRSPSGHAHP